MTYSNEEFFAIPHFKKIKAASRLHCDLPFYQGAKRLVDNFAVVYFLGAKRQADEERFYIRYQAEAMPRGGCIQASATRIKYHPSRHAQLIRPIALT